MRCVWQLWLPLLLQRPHQNQCIASVGMPISCTMRLTILAQLCLFHSVVFLQNCHIIPKCLFPHASFSGHSLLFVESVAVAFPVHSLLKLCRCFEVNSLAIHVVHWLVGHLPKGFSCRGYCDISPCMLLMGHCLAHIGYNCMY